VQLFDWGWDTHGTNAEGAVDVGLINKCRTIDKSITALILDLKQRGLLEETLVVWGGEFGRTPMMENRDGKQNPFKGRDHHVEAFTIWIQATILNQLGFDHEKFIYQFQGRPFRLTDVSGKVIEEIVA
jgi:hypothetical protein